MSRKAIGVGVIGANPESAWAAFAHLPALAALPDFRLAAVSTTRQETANAAAKAFGAEFAFDNHEDLVNCDGVDLVVVTVKVPLHAELVSAAIEAGKDVYCEWPLGRDEKEGKRLAQAAKAAGVRSVVGLQSRVEPAIRTVRDLIAAGDLGDIISTTMVGTMNPGSEISPQLVYLTDKSNGANALTINGGHTIDALCYCLGEFDHLDAVLDTRVPLVVKDSGEPVDKTSPDQIAVIGRLAGGAVASVHLREGLRGRSDFEWEINGTEGTLRLTAAHAHPGFYPLTVTISAAGSDDRKNLDIDPLYGAPEEATEAIKALDGTPAGNVGRLYAQYAHDRRTGVDSVPDFDDAVIRHQMITSIETSAGRFQSGSNFVRV